MTKSTIYYTLLVKYEKGDNWSIAFGDCDKECVVNEIEDAYADAWKTEIICTMNNQMAVDSEVSRLNTISKLSKD